LIIETPVTSVFGGTQFAMTNCPTVIPAILAARITFDPALDVAVVENETEGPE
jgi:hypothetical protein